MDLWAVEVTYWYHSGFIIVEAHTDFEAVDRATEKLAQFRGCTPAETSQFVGSRPERLKLPYLIVGVDH